VPLPFRRKSDDLVAEEVSTVSAPVEDKTRPRGYTPSKQELGKITPKRKVGGRTIEAPPANNKEARKRARDKQREIRAEARAGMMAGKEEYLLPRDKGPERALVRDIVDARRNIASYLLPGTLVVLLGSSAAMPAAVRLGVNLFWFMLAFAMVVDSVLLSRRVKKLVRAKLPKSTPRWGSLYLYAIMRSISFRRMRMPAPKVKIGTQL
jgi:hypothetical protein